MNLRKKAHNIIHSSLTKDEKVRKLVDLVMEYLFISMFIKTRDSCKIFSYSILL